MPEKEMRHSFNHLEDMEGRHCGHRGHSSQAWKTRGSSDYTGCSKMAIGLYSFDSSQPIRKLVILSTSQKIINWRHTVCTCSGGSVSRVRAGLLAWQTLA